MVFQAVVAQFGLPPVIDLLVTPLNSQLPVFISPFADPAAFGINMLSVPRDSFRTAYALPPMALVCDVLMELRGLDLDSPMVAESVVVSRPS